MISKTCVMTFTALTALLMTAPILMTALSVPVESENYVVLEYHAGGLSVISPAGARTVVYQFMGETFPQVLTMDSSGNYIVTELYTNVISKVTPTGERTVIYTFAPNTHPAGYAVDSSGNYIVCEFDTDILSKVTPGGERTVIYTFTAGTNPGDVITTTATELFITDVTENGLTLTWTQSA